MKYAFIISNIALQAPAFSWQQGYNCVCQGFTQKVFYFTANFQRLFRLVG